MNEFQKDKVQRSLHFLKVLLGHFSEITVFASRHKGNLTIACEEMRKYLAGDLDPKEVLFTILKKKENGSDAEGVYTAKPVMRLLSVMIRDLEAELRMM